MLTVSTSRIESKFRELEARRAKGLVVYLTAGDPTLEATAGLLAAVERGGADLIELGVPFSDPLADGPVIQRASERALRAGATLRRILESLPRWREGVHAPVILFSYYDQDEIKRVLTTVPMSGSLMGWFAKIAAGGALIRITEQMLALSGPC